MKHSDIPSFKDTSIDSNLAKAIKKYNPKKLLEVGVGLGSSTWNILDNVDDTQVYALDKFEFNPEPYRIEKIKQYEFYYKSAISSYQIVNNQYNHYDIFYWLINQHPKNCNIIKQSIWEYINTGANDFDFVFLDGQKHLPVLLPQLEFFSQSNIICGTGYLNEHNKIDLDLFANKIFVDNDFWLIDNT